MALAEKQKKTGRIAVAFLGDGTLGEGVVYESLNIASLWKLPILYVVENNHYAQTTPIELGLAGSISGRFAGFGIPVWEVDTCDAREVQQNARAAIEKVGQESIPCALILHTQRFAAHSKGDDLRPETELERIRQFDPLLREAERIGPAEREAAERAVQALIEDAFTRAAADPSASPEAGQP
jgi:TPP-dependent pyruvate/acetoin dehydrogenase alpha subunit